MKCNPQVAAVLLLSILSATSWASPAGARPPTSAEWISDLDFLKRELPRRHVNLFHALTREEFERAVIKLKRRVRSLDAQKVLVELRQILASVRDGHTGVNSIPVALQDRRYPFRAYAYSDGVFIQAISPEHSPFAGARLVAVDGVPIGEVMKRLGVITDGTNEQSVRDFSVFQLSHSGTLRALGIARSTESAEFLLEKDGQTTALTLKPTPLGSSSGIWMWMGAAAGSGWVDARTGPTPEWLKEQASPFATAYLPGSRTLYVRCNAVADSERPLLTLFREAIAQARARPTDRFVSI